MLCCLAAFLLKVFLYFIIIATVLVIALKLWLEPRKTSCQCKVNLDGKVAIVTGGNSGIGLETARALAKKGAKVVIASRNEKKSIEAVNDIIASTGNNKVEFKKLDLGDFESIKKFANEINKKERFIHILVNNAGVAGLKKKITRDGIDLTTQINHYGPFLLTNLLVNKLEKSKPSRIINVTSYAHVFGKINDLEGTKTISYFQTYANSKLLNVLWTKSLSKRLPEGVTVNCLHPGVVKTAIFNKMDNMTKKFVHFLIDILFRTAKEGAQTSIHLCVAPELEDATGGYYDDCRITEASKLIKRDDIVERVWSESVRLTET